MMRRTDFPPATRRKACIFSWSWSWPCRLLPVMASVFAFSAAASPTPFGLQPPALPHGGAYESLGDDVRIQGLALAAWLFEAPATVQEMTAWFSARKPALRDVWVVPGSLILGGVDGAAHWVVRMSGAGPRRTRGTVSALPLDTAGRPAHSDPTRPGRVELKGAAPILELQMHEDGHTVVHQVWTHAQPPLQACRHARAELLAAGWRAASVQDAWDGNGCGAWTRGAASLSVISVALETGSGIAAVLRIKDIGPSRK